MTIRRPSSLGPISSVASLGLPTFGTLVTSSAPVSAHELVHSNQSVSIDPFAFGAQDGYGYGHSAAEHVTQLSTEVALDILDLERVGTCLQ